MRSLIRFSMLAVFVVMAAAGCRKHPPAPTPGEVPPVIPYGEDKGFGTNAIPTIPNGPGQALVDPATGQKLVVHFEYDSAVVTHDKETLTKVAEMMKAKSDMSITVTGHCDERGSTAYNLSLGEHRALSVRGYLIGLGIDGSRLSSQSFGKEQPAAQGHDDASWRENRRAEFIAR